MPTKINPLNAIFEAKSIAVIGASRHRLKVGHQILANLKRNLELAPIPKRPQDLGDNQVGETEYCLYPINPQSSSILGLPCAESICDLEEPVELVVIATPAPFVIEIVNDIIERNRYFPASQQTKGVVIVTAGFAETSKEGKELQHAIATKLQLAGIALLGPNSLGCINPHTFLNASFGPAEVLPGKVAVISQSGAMLTAVFQSLGSQNLGVSFAVSLGNKAGISENECLAFAEHDQNTSAVMMYLESFSNLPEFFQLVSRVSKTKPVFILKGGVSQQGHQASVSHTAALATNQVLLQAAAEQMGFVLVDTIEQLLSITTFLARYHHLPENTLIMTNAGGPAVNTTDLLSGTKVALASWSTTAVKDFGRVLPQIPAHNPLDLLGDAGADRFDAALTIAQRDPQIDSVIVIVTQQAVTDIKAITEVLLKHHGKKVLYVALVGGSELEPFRQRLQQAGVLTVAFPNEAVEQLGILAEAKQRSFHRSDYQAIRKATAPKLKTFAQSGELDLPTPQPNLAETFYLLREYGFTLPEYTLITEQNLDSLKSLKYPLFAKTANLSLLHKKAEGGVYGVVHDTTEAAQAYAQLQAVGNEVLFQELIDLDHELLLGTQLDPQFGWFLSLGMGGSYTNLLADRSFIFLPTTATELGKSWQQTKAFKAVRGEYPLAVGQINKLLVKTQELLLDNPWIKSLEINPLVVNKAGVWAVDVKIGV